MKRYRFKKIIDQVPELNHNQRVQLREKIDHGSDLQEVCDILENRIDEKPHCPHCQSHNFIKHGFRSNLTRYRCKECFRTFNALTKTPLAKLRRKELWIQYARCLLGSATLRQAAATTEITLDTSFRWRHRFTALAQKNETQTLSGIIEADETFFLKSKKGDKHLERPPRKRGGDKQRVNSPKEMVCVLVACDRNGHEADYITGLGPLSPSWLKKNFASHLAKNSILITDSTKAYSQFCTEIHLEHIAVTRPDPTGINGPYHIQNVNFYHNILKSWMRRFHGVATKYLDHYLGWCHELHNRKFRNPLEVIQFAIELKTPITGT